MILAGYSSSKYAIIICIVFGASSSGIVSAGYLVNYLDLTSRHASILLGIGSTIATIPGIISPSLTSFIVKNGVCVKKKKKITRHIQPFTSKIHNDFISKFKISVCW